MKYCIDNLVSNAIKCAAKKNVFITATVNNCGTENEPDFWYFLRRGVGLCMMKCSSTSTRNLLFLVHAMVCGEKIEKWATKDDIWNPEKM